MIRKLSKKRAAQNRGYLKLREQYLIENPFCKVMTEGCTGRATTIHHKKGRIGKLLTDTNYFLGCCMNCHEAIERNPIWAKEKGYSLSRLSK